MNVSRFLVLGLAAKKVHSIRTSPAQNNVKKRSVISHQPPELSGQADNQAAINEVSLRAIDGPARSCVCSVRLATCDDDHAKALARHKPLDQGRFCLVRLKLVPNKKERRICKSPLRKAIHVRRYGSAAVVVVLWAAWRDSCHACL